jgi:ankyrin repeat protein
MLEPSAEDMPRMPMMGGPNALRFTQEGALHLAAVMCQTNMIRLLLASGASVNAVDGMGRTPLDMAKSAGFLPSALLIQRSFGRMDPLGVAEPISPFNRTAILDQQEVAIALLEKAGGESRQPSQRIGQPRGLPR